ncbi:hypothetical protein AUC68_11695 [Methyloceanibacter methanicus]|uniref:Uncharacterized protein n=2 Tax=Methyloceanibacter methanicus TaxID=1774968 RepID=A0A1E3W7G4_9HYPH|nr:hypothetical protein AUC68_11695 [Methyloceanibacter methanicus]
MLLTTIAFAEHAVPLDAEAVAAPQAAPSNGIAAERAPAPAATNVKVAFPSELDVYLVETGTREVCDTYSFGGGDVRTECRTEPLPVRAENPALRGICITRYGNRVCY